MYYISSKGRKKGSNHLGMPEAMAKVEGMFMGARAGA